MIVMPGFGATRPFSSLRSPTSKTQNSRLEVSIIQFRFNLERVFPKGFISFVLFGFECFWADSLGQTGLNETRQHLGDIDRFHWELLSELTFFKRAYSKYIQTTISLTDQSLLVM